MNATTEGGGIRPSGAAADELLARSRVEAAALRRRRERWRAERRVEETTLVGALLGALPEAGAGSVTVHLESGTALTGDVVTVGHDVLELDGHDGARVIRLDAVVAVETDGPLTGDPSDRTSVTLAEMLDEQVHDGIDATVTLRNGAVLRGELVGVGDALVLRASSPHRHVVVPIDRASVVSRPRR